ncbi:MAG: phosphonate ABC transporter, permease protein PhnE [Proteobacteria bacterium]|nr:phosphonate ABC transporter, permease protein PhnE [Pseudomonadota bacterium]
MALTRRRRMYSGILLVIFVVLMVASFDLAESRNAGGFWDGIRNALDFPSSVLSEFWAKRDEFPKNILRFLPSLAETLNIAAASTILGACLAVVLALLSTRGLALWPRLIPLFRRTMDILRAVPEIAVALVLIFVLGGGPVPAMIAIALHTAGALGKLFSEVAENADLKPVEGLASVGAGWAKRMYLGVIPQVAPNFLSYAMLRFEINIRASAILGFVGAGGIGYDLRNTMTFGTGMFDQAAAIFLLLFATIMAVDQISSTLRNRLSATQR